MNNRRTIPSKNEPTDGRTNKCTRELSQANYHPIASKMLTQDLKVTTTDNKTPTAEVATAAAGGDNSGSGSGGKCWLTQEVLVQVTLLTLRVLPQQQP